MCTRNRAWEEFASACKEVERAPVPICVSSVCACVEHCAVPSRSHPLQLGTSTPKLTMELPNPFNSPSDGTEGGLSPIGTLFLLSQRTAIVTLHLNSGISISWRHAPLHRNCTSKAVLAQKGRDGERERLPRLRRKRDIICFLCLWVDFFLRNLQLKGIGVIFL